MPGSFFVPKRLRLEFAYDARHRRIAKVVKEWEGDAVTGGFTRVVRDRRYVYDGWNMIAELDHTTATGTGLAGCGVVRTQVWGEDLSGTMQGAGGVGGLLMVRHGGQSYVPLMDGNGNVMGLQGLGGAKDGQTVARYDYDAFGNRITNTAPELGEDVCPFGFSTKLTDGETGLVYYGYRYYSPEMGRWMSRDPIGERGGMNLYGMVGNDAVNRWDRWGLIAGGGATPPGVARGPGPPAPEVPTEMLPIIPPGATWVQLDDADGKALLRVCCKDGKAFGVMVRLNGDQEHAVETPAGQVGIAPNTYLGACCTEKRFAVQASKQAHLAVAGGLVLVEVSYAVYDEQGNLVGTDATSRQLPDSIIQTKFQESGKLTADDVAKLRALISKFDFLCK